MIKAKRPKQRQIAYRGKIYKIRATYIQRFDAIEDARSYYNTKATAYPKYDTQAIVVDLGEKVGFMRYATFIRRGGKR